MNPLTRAYSTTPSGFRRPVDGNDPEPAAPASPATDICARVEEFLIPHVAAGRVPVARLVAAGLSAPRLRARVGAVLRDLGWTRGRVWSAETGQQWYWIAPATNSGTPPPVPPVVGVE